MSYNRKQTPLPTFLSTVKKRKSQKIKFPIIYFTLTAFQHQYKIGLKYPWTKQMSKFNTLMNLLNRQWQATEQGMRIYKKSRHTMLQ